MNSLGFIISISVATYVATNVDNLILLVALLARYRGHVRNVVAGYLVCMMILGFAAFSIGKAADILPVKYVGLLGLVPIFMGVSGMIRLARGKAKVTGTREKSTDGARSVFIATLATQLGNGADTIIAFGALFADSLPSGDILISMTLAATAVTFAFIANYASGRPMLSDLIRHYADRVTPFMFIIVGTYILANTATDLLPGS